MSKRDVLALEIVETVPKTRLIAAVLTIEQQRRRGMGLPDEFDMAGEDVEAFLNDTIHTATIRQLKILRDLALRLKEEIVPLH